MQEEVKQKKPRSTRKKKSAESVIHPIHPRVARFNQRIEKSRHLQCR
ncbi:hypothetical protein [Brevibacillus sp. SYSU BS000544]